MLTELRKSTNAILFERVSSPLFGTLIISWLIWNWKIVYLTIFISESKLEINKIDYIIDNYQNIHILITFPLISTFLLITVIPLISNGAFWMNLIYKKWKTDKKNEVEKTQLLTIEQSVELRKEIRDKEIQFEKILEKKTLDNKLLQAQIEELELKLTDGKSSEDSNKKQKIRKNNSSSSYGSSEYTQLKKNTRILESFEKIITSIRKDFQFPEDTSDELKEYYLINDIVKEEYDEIANEKYYELTFKGNGLYKDFFNEKFEIKE
jgi:hypothetical protein